ncbi:uncharacterized protein LOC143188996 [Calliopsis andreniformis]|uniref:uncharacterized protein LOC143188996 n=1 Tax=Calliopsis andreniformis TaxID=337506 RepID=UPI003FCCF1A4
MYLFAMPNFHGLTLFIWIVFVLTLSVGDEIKTDGTASSPSNNLSKSEHQASSIVQPKPVSLNLTNTLNKTATSLFAGEGGPISVATTIQQVFSTTSPDKIPIRLNAEDDLSKAKDNAQNTIKKITTVSKIVPRKGANEFVNAKDSTKDSTKAIILNVTKPETESSAIAKGVYNNAKNVTTGLNISKSNNTDKHLQSAPHITVNSSLHHLNTSQQNTVASAAVTASTIKEHKAKPTVTVAGPNSDKQPFVSSVRSHLGMPKKIDYVLPVIITLIALPVLGAIMFMIYKQGRDCWDKRHYRRMDFLIDGMYND